MKIFLDCFTLFSSFHLFIVTDKGKVMETEKQIERISHLVVKFLEEDLSEKEREELEAWRGSSAEHESLFQKLTAGSWDAEDYLHYCQAVETDGWQEIKKRVYRKRLLVWRRMIACAAAVCLIGVLGYWMWGTLGKQENQELPVVQNDIHPGTSKAVLKFADGKQVRLGAMEGTDSLLWAEYGIKEEGAALSYDKVKTVNEYHTLVVPRGGEYLLQLEDSTQVWVNSGSELKFPVRFEGGKREVYLKEGEAYFEVAKDEHRPFYVHVADMTVQVLGTGFNVSAYSRERETEVTLAHGSVRVERQKEAVVLCPDEQLVANADSFEVRKVDAGQICAWRKGILYFDAMPLDELAEKLGRWFNCEFFFTSEKVKNLTFTGAFKKYEDISYILSILESTADIQIQVNGKTIIIGNK